ncbi:MAG TPA: hypothetical protein VK203_31415 [Nostocaceae cyanobacterium]|nr:hypothetical protein [Nostocaceae cyanobacterium]
MQDKIINRELSSVDIIKDTWIRDQNTGSWIIVLSDDLRNYSVQEVNLWYINVLIKTLDSFSHLARAWRIHFGPYKRCDIEVINLEWTQESLYQEYIEKVIEIIRNYSAPIFEIGIDVELFIHIRTSTSPTQPIKTWVRLPDNSFFIHGGLGHGEAYIHFDVAYTLFGPATKEISPLTGPYPEPEEDFIVTLDDNELQLLNQPLLEQALQNWEEIFGSITDVEGIPGIYKYGFLVEPY